MSLSPRPETFTRKTFPLAAGARLHRLGDGVRRFERRNDAFRARKQARGIERFGVGYGGVLGAFLVVQPGVLGADHGVIQAGGNGVGERDLAVAVLQHVAVGALQDAGRSAAKTRRVFAHGVAAAAGFDADQLHRAIGQEGVEDADGVRAAAHAGEDGVRQRPSDSRIWRRASSPMIFWKSRTIMG